jgi:pimeloyl-ACP methyl ester carboxylesterase
VAKAAWLSEFLFLYPPAIELSEPLMKTVKHTYVLVSGAWLGGWVWRDVMPGLRERGHVVTAPTLTGLGEQLHGSSAHIGLVTHIDDVVAHIEMEDLRDVTLVGWSYGGMVTTGVAARLPDRIKSLIYVDAYVPEHGKALIDYLTAEQRIHYDSLRDDDKPLPPISLDVFGVTAPAIVDFVMPRLALQPWRTFYEPVDARALRSDIAIGYVYCSGYDAAFFKPFYEKLGANAAVRTRVIDTGHLCMLSEPEQTVEALISLA